SLRASRFGPPGVAGATGTAGRSSDSRLPAARVSVEVVPPGRCPERAGGLRFFLAIGLLDCRIAAGIGSSVQAPASAARRYFGDPGYLNSMGAALMRTATRASNTITTTPMKVTITA